MARTVIEIENLYKQYKLGAVSTGTISHDLNRWWHRLRGKDDPYQKITGINDRTQKATGEYVWALNDINFAVNEGEVLGIIGKNGAGKSTLLKTLSGFLPPLSGEVKLGNKAVFQKDRLIWGHDHIAVLAQDFQLMEKHTAFENLYHA